MLMSSVYNEIFDEVNKLEIIDSHEHLPHREEARDKNLDVLQEYLGHYMDSSLVSAGLPQAQLKILKDHGRSILERWRIAEPYWNFSRHTGYGRALDIAVKAIYDIEQINGNTIEQLNEAFQKTLNPGHYRKVLKDLSKIKICINDASTLDYDPEFFRAALRLDQFIFPRSMDDFYLVTHETGISVCCFEDWLEACEVYLDYAFAHGAVVLKCSLAYERPLSFERVTKGEAEACFNRIFRTIHYPQWELAPIELGKAFQDYMLHYILRLANQRQLTFQFHTGLQEGNGNCISNSNPELLSNLFLEYPNVDFDVFHIGYPYQHVMSALAKTFPNVYIDMCWVHIVSPAACIQALGEWLESVPYNKIIAFGGDYKLVDGVYGHQYLARMDVSRTLAMKVEEGLFGIEEAINIAQRLFYDNSLKLFKLEHQ